MRFLTFTRRKTPAQPRIRLNLLAGHDFFRRSEVRRIYDLCEMKRMLGTVRGQVRMLTGRDDWRYPSGVGMDDAAAMLLAGLEAQNSVLRKAMGL